MNIKIGPWLFVSERCLITSDSIERELDPLSFKLLSYFVANETRIITRQELVESVWQQSFVDDNAINRAISELRKQLSHPNLVSGIIKTHYRKGYSLTVGVGREASQSKDETAQLQSSQQEDVLEQPQVSAQRTVDVSGKETASEDSVEQLNSVTYSEQSQATSSNKLVSTLITIIVLLTIVVGYLWITGQETQTSNQLAKNNAETDKTLNSTVPDKSYKFSITSATWNHGGESNPLISSNKTFFAYSNIYQGAVNTYVKRLSDQAEVVLKAEGYDVGGLSWQVGESNLLAMLVNIPRKECHYALFDLSTFPNIESPKKLKACHSVSNGYGQLDKLGEYLYYTELPEGFSGAAIYQYDLSKQRSKVLVPPSDNPSGVIQLRLSPDGRYLAYLKSQLKAPMRVYILDLTTQETRLLHQMSLEHLNFALNWFDDGKHLLISEFNKLIKVDIDTAKVETITLPEKLSPFYAALEFDNQLLVAQQDMQQYQVFEGKELFDGGAATFDSPHSSESSDYFPEASQSNAGEYYFVSRRTGSGQIWRNRNSELEQITNFETSFLITSLVLSVDGKRLLFLHDNKMVFLDLNSNQLHVINELADINITNAVWGEKPQFIYFTAVKDNNKYLARFDLMTRQTTSIEANDVKKLLTDGSGNVFYLSSNYLVEVASGKKRVVTLPETGQVFVDMSENYLFGTDALKSFYRMSLDTGELESIAIPFKQRDFSVVDDNTVIFTKRQYKNTSIKRVSWQLQ
ncbi:MAG: winged helix-turn-helix domain-containing protein [Psychrobium sp.]